METYHQMFCSVLVMLALYTTLVFCTCCSQKTVSGVGDQLDGIYNYKEDRLGDVEDACQDGCVYTRANMVEEEYCFRQAMVEEGTVVKCDDSSERILDLASTPLLIGKASSGMFKIF